MRLALLLITLAVAGCFTSSAIEQCDRFRDALCERMEECELNDRATCLGNLEEEWADCDDVESVSDSVSMDLCIEDISTADCADLAESPPDLGAACDDAAFVLR